MLLAVAASFNVCKLSFVCVQVPVCVYVLRTVSTAKILLFKNTLVIIFEMMFTMPQKQAMPQLSQL